MKIYGISAGSYSDYHMMAFFKTKELAEEAIQKIKSLEKPYSELNDYLEVFELLTKIPEPYRTRRMQCWISQNDGSTYSFYDGIETLYPWDGVSEYFPNRAIHVSIIGEKDKLLQVSGTNFKKVEKTYYDKLNEIKATLLGLT